MFSRFVRRRSVTAALLIAALAIPALASASGGNSLNLKVPHTTTLGKVSHYTVKGTSSSASNTLEVLLNKGTVKCKSTFGADYLFEEGAITDPLKEGSFSKKLRLGTGLKGTYYLCGYIVTTTNAGGFPPTLAHASAKFVVKR